jgi:heme-degrading monooxygenase HmoA
MYIILWEYIVRSGREAEFEEIYGANGDWVQLFEQGQGYLGTDLVHDTPQHYITIDHWISSQAYEFFHKQYRRAYRALDARCQSLTERESLVGTGDVFTST